MRLTRFFARIVFNLRRANTFRSAVFYVHFSSAMLLLFSIPAFAIPAVAAGTSILDYHTLIKVEKGKLIQELDIEIQVNSKREDWIAEISIRYGEHDKLEILEAYITNPHGEVVRKLKKKDVISRSEVSADTFFENNLLQEFELKWHEYPYKIRYKYRRTTDQYIYIARWYPILFKSVPVLHATLQVQVPDDLEVLINYSDSLHYKAAKEEGITLHTWQSSYHNELSGQPYEVNLLERLPFVGIVPKDFVYVAPGSFSSWAEFGDWQSRILAGLDELPRSEQLVVDQLISGKNDEKEIIKTLYQHLQDHTRYVNVSIDEGGLVPYPSSYVCANKYGDCKALTNYMKALLSYAGITSYYTLINAGENVQRIDRAFPSQQFNHVILCVPLQQDTIWLENTSKYLPAGYIGTFTQNRYGLMVNGAESKLVKTPALGLEDVLENSIYHFTLDEEGTGVFQISSSYEGPEFEKFKYLKESLSERDLVDRISNSISMRSAENIDFDIEHPERDEPKVIFKGACNVSDQIKYVGKSLAIVPMAIFTPPQMSAKHQGLARINYPLHKSDTLVYQLSFIDQYLVKLPADVQIASKYGSYGHRYFMDGNRIVAERSFLMHAGNYQAEERKELYAFMEMVANAQQKSTIVFNPKQ